ncbi:hypothetical protein FCM35_KLT12873 [Carex littledalei]|uniref:DUF6598 domain-containing protein n=1 Tax=Carex littledalei TaxID=544730 RepID=A0A833QHK7_9POAL|nr:hypothetical protein FCM35_KLT12873 [Carex littledalei]
MGFKNNDWSYYLIDEDEDEHEDEMFISPKVYINGEKHVVLTHDLFEVFSVRFIDHSNRYISGNMSIELKNGNYYLFQSNKEDSRVSSIEVDSQGYAILTPDLQCPLDTTVFIDFYSHLEKLKGEVEVLRTLGKKKQKRLNKNKNMNLPLWDNRYEKQGQTLWNRFLNPIGRLMCKQVMTQAGPIEISYAAIYDAVEALVDITLSNWRVGGVEEPIKLYGIVTAKNSMIRSSCAKSILFQRDQAMSQYICVHPSMGDILLPLSRRKVVVPHNAALQVYIEIWQSLIGTEDKMIANDEVEVKLQPSQTFGNVIRTKDSMVIKAEGFDIQVKIKWLLELKKK